MEEDDCIGASSTEHGVEMEMAECDTPVINWCRE